MHPLSSWHELIRPEYAENVFGFFVWQAHRFHRGFGTFTNPNKVFRAPFLNLWLIKERHGTRSHALCSLTGFTDHVFALCHLLGFRFAPRIRDLADKRLYVPRTWVASRTAALITFVWKGAYWSET